MTGHAALLTYKIWLLLVAGQPAMGYATEPQCQKALAHYPHGMCISIEQVRYVADCPKKGCESLKP